MIVPLVWALGCELRHSGPVASTMTLKHISSPQSHVYNIRRAGDVMSLQMGLVAWCRSLKLKQGTVCYMGSDLCALWQAYTCTPSHINENLKFTKEYMHYIVYKVTKYNKKNWKCGVGKQSLTHYSLSWPRLPSNLQKSPHLCLHVLGLQVFTTIPD